MSIRVMHIELGKQLYGGAKQVEYLINALSPKLIENHLICARGSAISSVNTPHCVIHPLSYSGDTDLRFPFRLYRLINKVKPDIVHVHSRRGADVWGGLVASICDVPAICTRRVDNPESSLSAYKYRNYQAVVSISRGVHDVVSHHCIGIKQPVIHSAVDIDDFRFSKNDVWFQQQYAIPEHHHVIANFAQLIPRKGQRDLINAMQSVVTQRRNVTCLLFGKGKQHDAYQHLIDSLNLSANVKLCGFTDDVPRILPNIDIMVHPAYAEGLGVILLQGGACAVPMISCPVGGIPEIIEQGKTGLLTHPGDIHSLSRNIVYLLDNPLEAKSLGDAAFQHVHQHFSPATMAKAYESLYLETVTEKV